MVAVRQPSLKLRGKKEDAERAPPRIKRKQTTRHQHQAKSRRAQRSEHTNFFVMKTPRRPIHLKVLGD
jgi:hypothetical protein